MTEIKPHPASIQLTDRQCRALAVFLDAVRPCIDHSYNNFDAEASDYMHEWMNDEVVTVLHNEFGLIQRALMEGFR